VRRARRGARERRPDPAPAIVRRDSVPPPIDKRPEMLPDASRRERRGAIELLAVAVVLVALLALAVWFFFFAHNPLLHP
jgi:hypothetical protein